MNAERSGSTTLTSAEPRNGERTGCSIGGIAQPSSPASAMRRIITLAACVTLGVSTWAAAQEPLTRVSLDDALQLALKQNATVRAQEFELQAVKANEVRNKRGQSCV